MRALLADDHGIVRTALKYLIGEVDPDIAVAEAANYPDMLSLMGESGGHGGVCDGAGFGLAIMDLRMPGLEGLDGIRHVVEAIDPAPVVVFSVMEDPDEMRAVLAQGVRAYIPKSTDDALIANIVRLVLAGGTYVPPVLGGINGQGRGDRRPSLSLRLSQAKSPLAGASLGDTKFGATTLDTITAGDATTGGGVRLSGLTRRQVDVLALMAEGMANQDIGERLGLNLSTVKNHVSRIFKVLDVENRTQAVLKFNDLRNRG